MKNRLLGLLATVGLVTGALLLPAQADRVGAAWTDTAAARTTITSSKWATTVCVLWSNEARADAAIFTVKNSAPLGSLGWTTIVNKNGSTALSQLTGCTIVLLAGEAWGPSAVALNLAEQFYAAGGKVLSTGNDSGLSAYPFPAMITTVGPATSLPHGGNYRYAPGANVLSPVFPTWTPSPVTTSDGAGNPVLTYPSGVQCVAVSRGATNWCAALARSNAKKGRWVHLHTLIGSLAQPGDLPLTDAAISWLTTA